MQVDDGAGRERKVRVDYPSNSQRSKEKPPEREKIESVVTGEVTRKPRGFVAKIFGNTIADDSGTILGFVTNEVLVPAAKAMASDAVGMIADAIRQGVERAIYGEAGPRRGGRTAYTSYSSYSNRFGTGRPAADTRPPLSRQARATHDFNEIVIASRAEAEDVLDRMRDLISTYEVATVSDLYDLVNLTGEFTDNKWGWYDLRSAAIRTVRGGYMLQLPRTQPVV